MGEFDFLREHGFGVVYGAEATKRLIRSYNGPRKENNMNDQVQNAQAEPVLVDEQLPEFLKRAAEKLEKDGEVLIQTEEDVGVETARNVAYQPPTVH